MTTCRACGQPVPVAGRGRPRIWCSERCRKAQYAGQCVECGEPVCGTTPGRGMPERCAKCRAEYQHRTRYWTQERVVAALRAYAAKHDGQPPSSNPARRKEPGMPDVSTIQREFGTWTAAVRAAGLKPRQTRTKPA